MKIYSSTEKGIPLTATTPVGSLVGFSAVIPTLPTGAIPILDDISADCVGYVYEGAKNVWHIYDVLGEQVGITESPLESSPIDPIDLILLGPTLLKIAQTGLGAAGRLFTGRIVLGTTNQLIRSFLPILRSKLQRVSVGNLKFTETTIKHMGNPGRFVPLHILHLAIKYGKRMPDPQKIPGVYRYEIPMSRFFKRGGGYIKEQKTLEVIVRESDWTILHFMYF